MALDEATLKKHMPELIVGGAGVLALGVMLLGRKSPAATATGSFLPNTLASNLPPGVPSGPLPSPDPGPLPGPPPPAPPYPGPPPSPGPIPIGSCPPGWHPHPITGECLPGPGPGPTPDPGPIPGPGGACPPGYHPHPITGECVPDGGGGGGGGGPHAWWCDGVRWQDGGAPAGCAVYTSPNPPAFACTPNQRCQGAPQGGRPGQGGGGQGPTSHHPAPDPGPTPDPRYAYLHRRTHSEWWSYGRFGPHGPPDPGPGPGPNPPDPPDPGPPPPAPPGHGGPPPLAPAHDPGGYRAAAMADHSLRMAHSRAQMRLFR